MLTNAMMTATTMTSGRMVTTSVEMVESPQLEVELIREEMPVGSTVATTMHEMTIATIHPIIFPESLSMEHFSCDLCHIAQIQIFKIIG